MEDGGQRVTEGAANNDSLTALTAVIVLFLVLTNKLRHRLVLFVSITHILMPV
jgi:hypothetical protein